MKVLQHAAKVWRQARFRVSQAQRDALRADLQQLENQQAPSEHVGTEIPLKRREAPERETDRPTVKRAKVTMAGDTLLHQHDGRSRSRAVDACRLLATWRQLVREASGKWRSQEQLPGPQLTSWRCTAIAIVPVLNTRTIFVDPHSWIQTCRSTTKRARP